MTISNNRQIRWRQFRAAANKILSSAEGPWGRTDRVGDVARAMERAYAAGAADGDREPEALVTDGVVRWEGIPARAQEVLQDVCRGISQHLEALRDGSLVAVLEGASATGRKGDRARMSLWRSEQEGTLVHADDLHGWGREWAATSVSALVRLGIFEELKLADGAKGFAKLTPTGIDTVLAAIAARQLYVFEAPVREPGSE